MPFVNSPRVCLSDCWIWTRLPKPPVSMKSIRSISPGQFPQAHTAARGPSDADALTSITRPLPAEPVNTITMPTLLIAHKDVPTETVYNLLNSVYAAAAMQAIMTATQGAAADMTLENAPKAFVTPLHPGAYQFWSEQGVDIPQQAMPTQ